MFLMLKRKVCFAFRISLSVLTKLEVDHRFQREKLELLKQQLLREKDLRPLSPHYQKRPISPKAQISSSWLKPRDGRHLPLLTS